MRTYAEFQPTGFDTRGLGLADKQDWLVHPCGTNRDADCLTRSNFKVSERELEKIDEFGEDHTVERFGHWACGWFEIILVRPGTACAAWSYGCECALENYPVLDEDHWSDLQFEEGEIE